LARTKRQSQPCDGAAAVTWLQYDGAALQRQQSPNNRQAESSATRFGRVEGLEQLLRIRVSKADTAIGDVNLARLRVIAHRDVDRFARSGLAGIEQHIQQHCMEHLTIGTNNRLRVGCPDPDTRACGGGFDARACIENRGLQRDRLENW
jgi:hypothetical protein